MDLVTAPTVISIDPGGTTGWSIMVVHPEALVYDDVSVLENIEFRDNGQLTTGTDGSWAQSSEDEFKVVTFLLQKGRDWPGALWMIEDFVLRKASATGNRDMLSPVRITAALEFGLRSANGSLMAVTDRQSPSLAKTTATDERMKSWGLYQRAGGQEHARDGDRHGITALRRAKKDGVLRGKWWPHLYKVSGDLR